MKTPIQPSKLWLALLLAMPLAFASCDDDDGPEPEEDNELITTVTYVLTPDAGSTAPAVTITWEDLDGAGGAAPVITGSPLRANTTYTGAITVLDRTKTPAADITEEVAEEDEDHLFFYDPTPANVLTVTRTDRDANNREVGLVTRVVTTAAATGSLKITLRHQPGTKNGTFAPGDTDIEATVPVTVQ